MKVVPAFFDMVLFKFFRRLTVGLDKGGYYHELFLRDRLDLVALIQRVKVKGTGVRAKANPEEEPNLYIFPFVNAGMTQAAATMTTSETISETAPLDHAISERGSMMAPSNQMLPSTMMVVPRDYDQVQNVLEDNADRLVALQKPFFPVKNQGLLEQKSVVFDDVSRTESCPTDVNFDLLIDEMFRHNQSLDFADLLKLAAV